MGLVKGSWQFKIVASKWITTTYLIITRLSPELSALYPTHKSPFRGPKLRTSGPILSPAGRIIGPATQQSPLVFRLLGNRLILEPDHNKLSSRLSAGSVAHPLIFSILLT